MLVPKYIYISYLAATPCMQHYCTFMDRSTGTAASTTFFGHLHAHCFFNTWFWPQRTQFSQFCLPVIPKQNTCLSRFFLPSALKMAQHAKNSHAASTVPFFKNKEHVVYGKKTVRPEAQAIFFGWPFCRQCNVVRREVFVWLKQWFKHSTGIWSTCIL